MTGIPPLNSRWTIDSLRSSDGTSIRFGLYKPSDKPLRRCVVFLNGRTEYIEKNAYLAERLDLPDDCGFLTLDHRGQGASGGLRANVSSYDEYVNDAVEVINAAIPSLPYTMLAHSMGGLITLYGAMQQKFKPEAIACSAPLLRLPDIGIPHAIATRVIHLIVACGGGNQSTGGGSHHRAAFERNILTHDVDMYEQVCNSPYMVPSARFNWIHQTVQAVQFIFNEENIRKLKAPTLIMMAGAEQVVDPKGQDQWVQVASKALPDQISLELIHGARHELFSEIEKYRSKAIAASKKCFADFLK